MSIGRKQSGENSTALLLFSGGQDSSICLAWALEKYAKVETIGFSYGQRHKVELEARHKVLDAIRRAFPHWQNKMGKDRVLDASVLAQPGSSALTSEKDIVADDGGRPNTFVPGRNLFFYVLAAAYAYERNIQHLVGGMCQEDFSGYPDCRRDALDAQLAALNLGMEANFEIETPLMNLTKADSWRLAHKIGGDVLVNIVLDYSHTCYEGNITDRHEWGVGCGTCPACLLRKKGWDQFQQQSSLPVS